MKRLPISIQTFKDIREEDKIYVDKTRFIHNMSLKGKYYFLARPRRFGKSLLLTTLKSFFEGKKELFKGLYIYEKEKEWAKHPVVHLDYSLVTYMQGKEVFNISLLTQIKRIGSHHDITLSSEVPADAFSELIEKAYEKYGKVVVLIDEYDKPMVDTLTDEKRFKENREILKGLYGAIKGLDEYLRFVMLTGISRFSKVNIFSGMNNLEDISGDRNYSNIVGFTQEELEKNFSGWLKKLHDRFQMPADEIMGHIKYWYNGFSFDGINRLYNPFSILSLFSKLEFENYWFSSGTPTFLIDLIKKQKQLPESFENIKVSDLTGSTSNINNLPLFPLLYQTGYLTIEKTIYDGITKRYILNYPNEEVRQSFIRYIAAAFVGKDQYEIQPEALALRDALLEERPSDFVAHLQSFFSDIPHQLHVPEEAYYHSLAYMMLRLVGVQLLLEKSTDKGRIDAVLDLPDKIYIIEFKFAQKKSRIKKASSLAKKAVQQIEEKRYFEPYLSSGKKIILFGLGYLNKQVAGVAKVLVMDQ